MHPLVPLVKAKSFSVVTLGLGWAGIKYDGMICKAGFKLYILNLH